MKYLSMLVIAMLGTTAGAEDTTLPLAQHLETVINARPLERPTPNYPRSAARKRQEGWVQISYVVDRDGNVLNPVIENSSGIKSFERAALASVQDWKFSPAEKDGEPIQQCSNHVQLDFRLSNDNKVVTQKFNRMYRMISNRVENGDLQEAADLLAKLKEQKRWNMYESTLFWALQASLSEKSGDKQQEFQALERVVHARSEELLPQDLYAKYVYKLLVRQIEFGQYLNALDSYARLEKLPLGDDVHEQIAPIIAKVEAHIDGPDPLATDGEIEEDRPWSHKLYRSSFTLAELNGEFDKMEIRCKNQYSSYTVAEGSTWHIPADWGQCTVYVYGEPESRFTLLELADESSQTLTKR